MIGGHSIWLGAGTVSAICTVMFTEIEPYGG
jgi:hypothetical protein